ncbi:16S rRNA processing protein RimM [Fulvivirga sp. M361]|uniref:ribosome maturation factor RimM n=1 Tax=Fulvivirga sp. M361 TaxID=2594266 RepID=UPI00117A6B4E|nr:ribosome maturation factor RimM [Fulvivirga sp. M361]TRX53032.1 16S rRNA processing protein RimM [Fulvivirga sp. M361]
MKIDECYQLGYVIKKHGLKGEVNVLLDVDHPLEYSNLESVFVEINQKLVPFFVEYIQIKQNKALIKFEDINSIEQAEDLRSCALYLPLTFLPELDSNQFYYHEIIGYAINDDQHGSIGRIKDVYTSGKQDLLAIEFKAKEILVPITDEVIRKVDHERNVLEVALPDGLLEIYLD